MAFTPLSAKNAKVFIGNIALVAKKWSVNPIVDELDTTNFEGGGYGDRIGGITDAEYTVELDFNSDLNAITTQYTNSFKNPPNIVANATLTDVRLYLGNTGNVVGPSPTTLGTWCWHFPSSLVLSVPTMAEVRGLVTLTFTAKSKGIYNYPNQ